MTHVHAVETYFEREVADRGLPTLVTVKDIMHAFPSVGFFELADTIAEAILNLRTMGYTIAPHDPSNGFLVTNIPEVLNAPR